MIWILTFLFVSAGLAMIFAIWNAIMRRHKRVQITMTGLIATSALIGGLIIMSSSDRHQHPDRAVCLSSLKQLALTTILYTVDNDDRMPLAGNWPLAIQPYTKHAYNRIDLYDLQEKLCNKSDKIMPYAMNAYAPGAHLSEIINPEAAIGLFESDLPPFSLVGTKNDVVYRHNDRTCASLIDGHVKAFSTHTLPKFEIPMKTQEEAEN